MSVIVTISIEWKGGRFMICFLLASSAREKIDHVTREKNVVHVTREKVICFICERDS